MKSLPSIPPNSIVVRSESNRPYKEIVEKYDTSEFCTLHPQQKRDKSSSGGRRCPICRREYRRKYAREHRYTACNRRTKAIQILGSSCQICGEADLAVLQFDHINNDGSTHRAEIGSSSVSLEYWIIDNPTRAQERIQVLCANCHSRKHSVFNKCSDHQPHGTRWKNKPIA